MDIFRSTNDGLLTGYSDKCPYCKTMIVPTYISHTNRKGEKSKSVRYVTLLCSNLECGLPFISTYLLGSNNYFEYNSNLSPISFDKIDVPSEINIISPKFVEIYNQAYVAQQLNLSEISGVGYRKALEFLIKDYAGFKNPDELENIKKSTLGNVINNKIDNPLLVDIANRATWIGNDETHYVRLWEEKDIVDLKNTIQLAIDWIAMLSKYEELLSSMPAPRKH